MATYTLCLGRGLSLVAGSAGPTLTHIFQIYEGDRVTEFNSKQIQKDLFYFKTVDLEPEKVEKMREDIANGEGVYVTCFTEEEKNQLKARGAVSEGLGSSLSLGTISNLASGDNYSNIE